ncbi:hypothetical protein ACMGE9_04095 [Macrococcus sp. EM39E]|uniref:hypothetical protein n=1 Tax=Macrococcus animalis TaxID=3395467 RepID=UPI0039BEA571
MFYHLTPSIRHIGEMPLILISAILSFSITSLGILFLLINSKDTMTLSADAVTFHTQKQSITIRASDIHYCYVGPKSIVLYGRRKEIIYGKSSGSRRKMIGLFKYYGYEVVKFEPYKNEYIKWYKDHPSLDEVDNDLIEQYLYYRSIESSNEEKMLSRLRNNGIYIKRKASGTYFRKVIDDPEMIDPFKR